MLLSTSEPALAAGVAADAEEVPVLSLFATHTGGHAGRRLHEQLAFDNAFQGSVATLFVRDELLLERVAYSVPGVEGYRVLELAMNRCENPVDRACVNRMIRDTRGLEGVTGLLSIGRDGKAVRPVVVNAIRDGYMEVVVKVTSGFRGLHHRVTGFT